MGLLAHLATQIAGAEHLRREGSPAVLIRGKKQATSLRRARGSRLRASVRAFGLPLAGLLFLLPSLLFLVVLRVYPLIFTGYLSAFDWSLTRPDPMRFVGLANYLKILASGAFWESIKLTLVFMTGTVLIELLLGLGIALLLNREVPGISAVRTLVIMPMMVTPVVVGILWRILLNEDMGLARYLVERVGLEQPLWFSNPSLALMSLMVVDIWQWTSFMSLLILAGLQSLPQEPFEAASIDGASGFQQFRYITLPLSRPFVLLAVVFRSMDSFRVFDTVYVLTGGGPGRATEVISILTFRSAFRYFEIGYTSALTLILLLVVLIPNLIALRALGRRESAGGS